ncbi:DUF3906 family protein [Paenibacillus sp. TRM 82003]|nr:DUF3906 family protein [Paenibacillus sp. TRM 82003]
MFLYKIECVTSKGESTAILVADSDEAAFAAVEVHLTRHYIAKPDVDSMALVEKKRIEKGSGYIIETNS